MPYTDTGNAPESIHDEALSHRLASATPVNPRVLFEEAYVIEKTMSEWWKARCLTAEAKAEAKADRQTALRSHAAAHADAIERLQQEVARAHAAPLALRAASKRLHRKETP